MIAAISATGAAGHASYTKQAVRAMSDDWHLYVLECDDGTLYTGITTDVERRLREHNETTRGAKYTRARRPVELMASWSFPNQSEAARAEYEFKALDCDQKWARIEGGEDGNPVEELGLAGE